MDRRDFLKAGALAGAVTAATRTRAQTSATAPSDRLRVGFLGAGARAHQLMDAAADVGGIEIVALTDAYTGRAERGRARAGGKATIAADYRTILADRAIDAVFIATPDHWHHRMALDALDAGKDVYIEKPLTYTADEGLDIVRAVERTRRVLQVGSQGVSSAETAQARAIVQSGRLGQITLIRASFHRNTAGGAWLYPIPPDASEKTVDWKQFLGNAPARPFSLERFFRWRCYWDYSGGLATDLFVHLVSSIHAIMGVTMPDRVMAAGATYRWKSTHEVPDTIDAILTYPEQFTVTLACTLNSEAGGESGMEILGTKGTLRFRDGNLELAAEQPQEDNRWVVRSWPDALERAYYADPKVRASESPDTWRQRAASSGEQWRLVGEDATVAHIRAFVEAVRSRQQPVEDARFGHRAAACAHMINRSLREGRLVQWDRGRDAISGQQAATPREL
jgi:predicted dehydrogenase